MCVFARGSSDEAFLLEPGKSRGTAGYMSPEHAKGKPLEPGKSSRQFHLAMRLRGIRSLLIAAW